MSVAVYTHPREVRTLHPASGQARQVAEAGSPGSGAAPTDAALAPATLQPEPKSGQAGRNRAHQDAYTLGRSRFVAGGMLEQCTSAAERAGYIGAEADARKADLRAMMAVGFDEWQLHRREYDEEM